MGEIESYKLNCDYMREQFSLPESTSLYALVNKITDAYRNLMDEQMIKEAEQELMNLVSETPSTEVEPSHKEKKRGRPRKS